MVGKEFVRPCVWVLRGYSYDAWMLGGARIDECRLPGGKDNGAICAGEVMNRK